MNNDSLIDQIPDEPPEFPADVNKLAYCGRKLGAPKTPRVYNLPQEWVDLAMGVVGPGGRLFNLLEVNGAKEKLKAVEQIIARQGGNVIVVANSATETKWCQTLLRGCDAFWFTRGRIAFEDADGIPQRNNTVGQLFFLFGEDESGGFEFGDRCGRRLRISK